MPADGRDTSSLHAVALRLVAYWQGSVMALRGGMDARGDAPAWTGTRMPLRRGPRSLLAPGVVGAPPASGSVLQT